MRGAAGTSKAELASRICAAVLGGYLLAYAFTGGSSGFLAAAGLLARADAVLVASMLSFLVYLCAIVYAFGARTARQAWVWIGGGAILFGSAAVLAGMVL